MSINTDNITIHALETNISAFKIKLNNNVSASSVMTKCSKYVLLILNLKIYFRPNLSYGEREKRLIFNISTIEDRLLLYM